MTFAWKNLDPPPQSRRPHFVQNHHKHFNALAYAQLLRHFRWVLLQAPICVNSYFLHAAPFPPPLLNLQIFPSTSRLAPARYDPATSTNHSRLRQGQQKDHATNCRWYNRVPHSPIQIPLVWRHAPSTWRHAHMLYTFETSQRYQFEPLRSISHSCCLGKRLEQIFNTWLTICLPRNPSMHPLTKFLGKFQRTIDKDGILV